jgi:tRNA-2-methylthio-N6-dimethylallyladenosine synthase
MLREETVRITPEEMEAQRQFAREFANLEDRPRTYHIVTYGCQMNAHDSEKLAGMLEEMGLTAAPTREEADFVLHNTCCIRDNAERKALGNVTWLKEIKKERPQMLIGVCGCMVQEPGMAEKILRQYPFVDVAFGTGNMHQLPELLYRAAETRRRVVAVPEEQSTLIEGLPIRRESDFQAYVTIMYGCNNFCSYCIVPYVRGRERSRKPEDVVEEVRGLAEAGYREITLLGQNVNSYGKDLGIGVDFADLLDTLAQIPGDFVLRFMTSHPKDASKKLFDTMAKHEKIAKQLHLPFQAGSDRVLREMNRRYTAEGYLKLVDYARSVMPGLVLTSDVIVGFPGETEEEFSQTVDLIRKVRFDALFTFIFSPRTGTPAAKMEDPVSRAEKQVWFDRLLEEQNRISSEIHADYIGKTLRVLIDGTENGLLTARTDGGRLVRLEGDESLVGSFREVVITGSTTWSLTGTLV